MIKIRFRTFLPDEILNISSVQHSIIHTMSTKTHVDLRRELEKTVRTWDHKPNWTTNFYFGTHKLWVRVLTYSTKYRLVNAGARPHVILPRRAKVLRFQTGFRPKSRPRIVGSFAGGKFGSYISSRGVRHPGHEAREFDAQIAEEYQDTFAKDMQEAITKGIVRLSHTI